MKPHVDIGPGYCHRWHVIPRNPWVNIYLHHFLKPDAGRHLHDHPWWSVSIRLWGWYTERTEDGIRTPRFIQIRRPTDAHRIDWICRRGCWTLFLTGPVVRRWGFLTNSPPWTPYDEYEGEGK